MVRFFSNPIFPDRVSAKVIDVLRSRPAGRPFRIGIDGITGSGKSTIASRLADELRGDGFTCISLRADDFHNPRSVRYSLGRESAEGYLLHAYDWRAIEASVLRPLGPNGDMRYVEGTFDHHRDRPLTAEVSVAPINSILVMDGSFLFRNEVRFLFDLRVFVELDYVTAEDRASSRDIGLFGSQEDARRVIRGRYHGAHRLYEEAMSPRQCAHFVVDNVDELAV